MQQFDIEFIIQSIVIGFLVVPLLKTISLHGIQLALIFKHKLPLSGVNWIGLLPIMVRTYLNFLFSFRQKTISCKLAQNKGGFTWSGIFKWEVW